MTKLWTGFAIGIVFTLAAVSIAVYLTERRL